MTITSKEYPITVTSGKVDTIVLTPPGQGYGTSTWIVVKNVSPYPCQVIGTTNTPSNRPSLPPGMSDKYQSSGARGPLKVSFFTRSATDGVTDYYILADFYDGASPTGTYPATAMPSIVQIESGTGALDVTITTDSGPVSVEGTLTLTGPVTITGPITVESTPGKPLDISGPVTVSGSATVVTTPDQPLAISGPIEVSSVGSITDSISISGTAVNVQNVEGLALNTGTRVYQYKTTTSTELTAKITGTGSNTIILRTHVAPFTIGAVIVTVTTSDATALYYGVSIISSANNTFASFGPPWSGIGNNKRIAICPCSVDVSNLVYVVLYGKPTSTGNAQIAFYSKNPGVPIGSDGLTLPLGRMVGNVRGVAAGTTVIVTKSAPMRVRIGSINLSAAQIGTSHTVYYASVTTKSKDKKTVILAGVPVNAFGGNSVTTQYPHGFYVTTESAVNLVISHATVRATVSVVYDLVI